MTQDPDYITQKIINYLKENSCIVIYSVRYSSHWINQLTLTRNHIMASTNISTVRALARIKALARHMRIIIDAANGGMLSNIQAQRAISWTDSARAKAQRALACFTSKQALREILNGFKPFEPSPVSRYDLAYALYASARMTPDLFESQLHTASHLVYSS